MCGTLLVNLSPIAILIEATVRPRSSNGQSSRFLNGGSRFNSVRGYHFDFFDEKLLRKSDTAFDTVLIFRSKKEQKPAKGRCRSQTSET
jgi:hypothetical protein